MAVATNYLLGSPSILHAALPLAYASGDSSDKTFDWVLTRCLLVCTMLAVGAWSIFDSKRANYVMLQKWFRLFVRFELAGQMIAYGLPKVIPLQMPFPYLTKLVEPFGDFSRMGVLWSFVGSSPGFETFVGCAEIVAGILIIIPRTTPLGALICLADMAVVFAPNLSYDVSIKLFLVPPVVIGLVLAGA